MERLKYIVEDSTIAELLGVQNFTNKESAILELVKNAYDAQASTVSITFSDHSIVIVDDGIGMSKSTIYENWMHVGKSDKGYSLFGVGENDGRVLAGSKGVGRFALARLGESVAVYSVKKGEVPVKWTTDWSESILDDFLNEENLPTGTRIEISALRDRWTEKSIRNLIDYLSITCNDNRMNIKVFPDYGKKVSYIFKRPQLGENFVTQIALFYDASEMKLHYTIESDEFSNIAKNYCPSTDLQHFSSAISILDELAGSTEIDFPDSEWQLMLRRLGDFSAEFYFSYAGGVSELTPNEFRTISVPYRQIKPCDIERVKTMFSNNVNLNQIVAFVNSKTLKSDLTTEEISRLNTIRVKLIGRRK